MFEFWRFNKNKSSEILFLKHAEKLASCSSLRTELGSFMQKIQGGGYNVPLVYNSLVLYVYS